LSAFRQDCDRIAQLSNNHLRYLSLCGGEPLLHPYLTDLMSIARKFFYKNSYIIIITNGILLAKQPKEFWNCCSKYDIHIGITKYPIHIDIEKIYSQAEKFHVKCGYYIFYGLLESLTEIKNFRNDKEHSMYYMPLDLTGGGGRQYINKNFSLCGLANSCFTLREGKMYTCATAAHIDNFIHYFNINLQLCEDNSIDIYRAKTQDEILSFLAKPIHFCAFCDVKRRTTNNKWSISKQLLSEWT
jgi:hypothetical protein